MWSKAKDVNLTEEWTRITRFQIPRARLLDGYKRVNGRPSKIHQTTRPDTIRLEVRMQVCTELEQKIERNKGIWHVTSMNETKKPFLGDTETHGTKNDGPQRDNQYSRFFCKAVGWRLTDLDPFRHFPLFFLTNPEQHAVVQCPSPKCGHPPICGHQPRVSKFVFRVWVHVVVLSRLPIRFCPFVLFSRLCLFMLSQMSVYCPT